MQLIADVHLHPGISIPLAVIAGVLLLSYWFAMGDDEVPESRRRIRRASVAVMLVSLPILVRGLSFVDPDAEPTRAAYVQTWVIIIGVIGVMVLTAVLDVLNNFRLHARTQSAEALHHAQQLAIALEEHRKKHAGKESAASQSADDASSDDDADKDA